MWMDMLDSSGIVLCHGVVDDLFFDEIKSGEERLLDYIRRHALGRFDAIYYTDLVTPLACMYERKKDDSRKSNESDTYPSDRYDKMAAKINGRTEDNIPRHDVPQTLDQITRRLESQTSKNLVLVGFIEKICMAQMPTEQDRFAVTTVLKWQQSQKISRSQNLAILICQNWNQLSSELKCSGIRKVEIPFPDAATHEAYLRYLIHYFKEVEK